MLIERPGLMTAPGTMGGWGWWDSFDDGDVATGLKNTTILNLTGPCPTPLYFGPGGTGATQTGFSGGPLSNTNCYANYPWSFHFAGANMMLADGSARFVFYSASQVLPALATRAGGEVFDSSILQ
jgi:hypothetical protein